MKFEHSGEVRRLAIYFFYDKEGVVDDYIPYLLKDLKENVGELLVVCNGQLTVEGRSKFNALTPHLIVRDNTGYDVWAYKAGLEYYGWEKLSEYDEIVLLNFTIMGPVYPFKGMFEEMNGRGETVVIVTHDPRIAERCRRVVRIVDGRIQDDTLRAAA